MKLLFVVHQSVLDAALPLIKRLKNQCDLQCLIEFDLTVNNILNVKSEDFHGHNYIDAKLFLNVHKLKDFFPLNNTYFIKYYPPKDLFNYMMMQFYVIRVVNIINPDFTYFYNIPIEASLFSIITKRKWASAIHDPIPHSGEKHVFIRSLFLFPVYNNCKDFFLFSSKLIDDFIKLRKISINRIHLTKLGVYEALVTPNIPTEKIKNNKIFNLLFFGKIKSYKGLRYLLESYKLLLDEGYNNISLTIAGSGYIEKDIIPLDNTDGLNIINRYIPECELSQLISRCDLVVCPYIDATQSGVIMSAYAFCKPVLATNVGGLSEMVINDVTGRLINPKDHVALANNIKELLLDPSILQKWSDNINNEYYHGISSWDSISKKLLSDIRKL